MRCYLKTKTGYGQAYNPKIIFCGKCSGSIVFVQHDTTIDKCIDYMEIHKGDYSGCIFLCESVSMDLLNLLPFASGFIFKKGSNLSHFANILRKNSICSCIDEELWHYAMDTIKTQENIIFAEFVCGKINNYQIHIKESYEKQLITHVNKLESNPIALPFYDIKDKVIKESEEITTATLGLKALSINALKYDEYLVPKTLIITGISEYLETETDCVSIINVMQKTFPELGNMNRKYMVRASLYADHRSKVTVSGQIKTCSFETCEEFNNIYKTYMKTWMKIHATNNYMRLAIIIQEQVPTSISGVVFTRLPWDFLNKKMILDLSMGNMHDYDSGKIQLALRVHDDMPQDKRIMAFRKQVVKRLAPALPEKYNEIKFYDAFAEFLNNCMRLQKKYCLPLDIEFAMTIDYKFYFTQFRYIHFMS
jgi:hypothetical protein